MDMPTIQNPAVPIRENYKDRATRFEASRNDACLTWKESSTRIDPEASGPDARRLFALLLDISQTGASIALDRVPRRNEIVRLKLDGEGSADGTEAEVVAVETTTLGPHLVRLAFRAPCPFDTLLAAICG